MSASLVGSEMCIRDRSCTTAPCQTGRRPSSAPPPWSPAAGRSRRHGPVSYTHLTLPTICSV
eukprot:1980791-Alexandrium_andersonii.AAC.1